MPDPSLSSYHQAQVELWDAEHAHPFMFPFVASDEPAESVVFFATWLQGQGHKLSGLRGLEMCCGKGRNVNWLSAQGVVMDGFDVSAHAIDVARKRAEKMQLDRLPTFTVHDAITSWPYATSQFDFVLDCFGSTELESSVGRTTARDEGIRCLKDDGFYFVASVSAETGFHRQLALSSPGPFENTVLLPNGKIETVMSPDALMDFYGSMEVVLFAPRLMENLSICGSETNCLVHWLIAQPK